MRSDFSDPALESFQMDYYYDIPFVNITLCICMKIPFSIYFGDG